MPKDLPGLYWDAARNRYFPESSRPKTAPPPPATLASTHQKAVTRPALAPNANPRRWHPPLHSTVRGLSTESYTTRLRDRHDLLCFHYAATSRLSHVKIPTLGHIQTLCSTQVNGHTWRFIGDNEGWLYSNKDIVSEDRLAMHHWLTEFNIQPSSPISSMSISGTRCVSTCLGPGKFSVQDLAIPDRMYLLNLNGVNDIRTSDLQGRALALGASKKAVYISDIDVSSSPQYLHTKSDVFAIAQERTLVYTGARNGTVERFDMRMAKQHSTKLFDARFGAVPRSSVVHLALIRDHEMLLSHLNGDLVTFDMRFRSTTPLKVFTGHVNRDIPNLGIATDPAHDFLFAAGQDQRIRSWSLRTARPLALPTSSASAHTTTSPFATPFPRPIVALQVTDEGGAAGRSLWAAANHDLYQFHLGQRAVDGL